VSSVSAALRRQVFARARNCCEYCRQSAADSPFPYHIEHIIAQKHKGQTDADNLCLSCPDCNAYKGSDIGSLDPVTNILTPLFNPRTQHWDDHFLIHRDTGHLEAITPEGRVTIELLRLNSPEQIEVRILLLQLDQYPC
jgi:hypothetical protein